MHRRTVLHACALACAGAAALPARAQGFDAAPWPRGLPLPPLRASDLAGRSWDLAALRGRAVLVNFWASWCEPCRAELPSMQVLADVHGDDRLVVLCVNARESLARVAAFVAATGLRLPVLPDVDGRTTAAWGVRVFPTSVLVAHDGTPRWRIRGEVDWSAAAADRLVAPLLAPALRLPRQGNAA